jgi:Uma2 family endonuclease
MLMALQTDTDPRPLRWTIDEYYRLGELGFFQGRRVELIEGELLVSSPQNAPHGDGVEAVADAMYLLFKPGFRVRVHLPLRLGPATEPEPDVYVVAGTRNRTHPTAAVLVVEVSDSSLADDRTRKASLYASAGIADYWIVNLVENLVEVRRDPVPDPNEPHGFRYATVTAHAPAGVVSPLALPSATVAVADLLP